MPEPLWESWQRDGLPLLVPNLIAPMRPPMGSIYGASGPSCYFLRWIAEAFLALMSRTLVPRASYSLKEHRDGPAFRDLGDKRFRSLPQKTCNLWERPDEDLSHFLPCIDC
jgi:hypothetical protein